MPGVPPETVNNVKRLLKGIFRRGRNKKEEKPSDQPSSSQPATSPPVLPSTTNGTAPAIDKPLPPTHPRASEQHDEAQEAVPQDHTAQPGPVLGAQDVKAGEGQAATSAAQREEEKPPAPPPKNDGAFDAPKPVIITSDNKENVPTTANVPLSDSAMATPNTPAKPDVAAAEESKLEPASNNVPVVDSHVEEKVPVHVDAAAPKANPTPATTHGMSATSGPLEDFPAGIASDKE